MPELTTDFLYIVFWVVIAILLLQHVLGPVIVWQTASVPFPYRLLPADIPAFIERHKSLLQPGLEQLQALGYTPVAVSEFTIADSTTSFLLFQHHTDLSTVMQVIIANKAGMNTFVEFNQRFTDEVMLDVSSAAVVDPIPASPMKINPRFPNMPAGQLLDNFNKIRNRLLQHKSAIKTLTPGRELEEIAHWLDQEALRLVKSGHFCPAGQDGKCRPTIKGACLIAWILIWPWKPLVNRSQLANAQRQLNHP